MTERPFVGGNLSESVRAGDTVRRRAGPGAPAVHALLRHFAKVGFEGAPRAIGVDERGREVLGFMEGEVQVGWPDPLSEWVYSEECLEGAARLLRRYHDSLRGFAPPDDARWRIVAPTEHEVVCHNDAAPYNTVFREWLPFAFLDWDLAGPGSRAWDVARSAYTRVPLYAASPRFTVRERGARLARFCTAYGLASRRGVVDVLIGQLRFLGDFITEQAEVGDPGFVKLQRWGVREGLLRDVAYLDEHRLPLQRG